MLFAESKVKDPHRHCLVLLEIFLRTVGHRHCAELGQQKLLLHELEAVRAKVVRIREWRGLCVFRCAYSLIVVN